MRIAITGASGFLGARLARLLLDERRVALGGAAPAELDELVLCDLVAPRPELAADPRVRPVVGGLAETLGELRGADAVFHLAGVVSSAAEADLDLGLATNVDATRALLDLFRHEGEAPVLVFSSSLAVFGTDPAMGAASFAGGVVDDDTLPRPQSSYGVEKFIAEQYLAEYSRRGYVRGRGVRLMTVSVRPGRPNAAASSFLSGIIREPLAGERASCPVPPDTPVALSSPRLTVEGLLRAAAASDAEWGSTTAMNLPALTTTPAEMVAALERIAGADAAALVDWTHDESIAAIVTSWPARFRTPRANALGLHPERSFDDIVAAYLADLAENPRLAEAPR